jgi:hypothetical protein
VSLELSNRASDTGIDTFAPADHLLGIVQRVVAARVNKRIVLPGKGEIVILPARGEYYDDVRDMVEFCSAPSAQFTTTPFGETVPLFPSIGKSINDLLWNAAFHASRGRLIEGCSICDFVKFRHWPNLTRLPVTPNTARICALLTRHRTVIMIAHQILGITNAEVHQVYSAAYCAGISNAINPEISNSTNKNPAFENFKSGIDEPRQESEQKQGLFRSLLVKISGL